MQRSIRRLPGTTDLIAVGLREHVALRDLLGETLSSWGYEAMETPLLEEADLFLRKSGGELAARLYSVDDPGGWRVALRPEYTASVIRVFVTGSDRASLPARWRYAGPIFRHHPSERGERRQVTQVGAELVGASGLLADAEVLTMAGEGLRRAGIKGTTLTLGHLGVLGGFLSEFGLSDRAELFLLSRLADLRDPKQGSDALLREARLLRLVPEGAGNGDLAAALGRLGAEDTRAVVHQLVAALGPAWVGSRDMKEVEARLLEKLRAVDDPDRLARAVRFLAELVQVHGEPSKVLRESEAVARRYGLDPHPLQPLAALAVLLADLPEVAALRLRVDLGLAPGLAYYTGMVFELSHSGVPGRALGGGGRYDGLVKALGGPDLPALGFAYSLELLQEARAAEGLPALAPEPVPLAAVVVPLAADDAAQALAEARRRRASGAQVALFSKPGDLEGAHVLARERGASHVIVVGSQGPRTEIVEMDRDAAVRPPQ